MPMPWYETFFDGAYGRVLAGQFDTERSDRHARLIKRLLRLRKGQRVLDVPTAKGRVALPLARFGLQVTGVDRSSRFLRKARRAARDEGLDAQFVQCDMRRIDFPDTFDGAFNWFGSFGYFSDADNLLFCRRVLAALKPGGRFLVEGMNKSWLLNNFRSRAVWTAGGVIVHQRTKWNARTNRVRDRWTLSTRGRTEEQRVEMRIYNGGEIRALLRKAGFRDITLYGYRPLRRLTRWSQRWIAVARRPLGTELRESRSLRPMGCR